MSVYSSRRDLKGHPKTWGGGVRSCNFFTGPSAFDWSTRKDSQRKLQVTCFRLSETPSEAAAFILADKLMATEKEHTWIPLSS